MLLFGRFYMSMNANTCRVSYKQNTQRYNDKFMLIVRKKLKSSLMKLGSVFSRLDG